MAPNLDSPLMENRIKEFTTRLANHLAKTTAVTTAHMEILAAVAPELLVEQDFLAARLQAEARKNETQLTMNKLLMEEIDSLKTEIDRIYTILKVERTSHAQNQEELHAERLQQSAELTSMRDLQVQAEDRNTALVRMFMELLERDSRFNNWLAEAAERLTRGPHEQR